jgi:RND family efflux transporter MFP subunit
MIARRTALPFLALAITACHREPAVLSSAAGTVSRTAFVVHDTSISASLEASGIAAPVREATLSTKLMGSVTDVLVREGQRVRAGDLLLRIDARDVNAQGAQAAAGVAQAEAVYANARAQTERMRALYADSAAPKAQLDEAEAGLARAEAGVRAARAASSQVDAVRAYADVRAPFDGTVVKRFVDPGAFVAPGAPLVSVQDASRLRLSVSVAPLEARGVRSGDRLAARVEDRPASAVVEGVVPAAGGAIYTVNALIDNGGGQFLAGGSGTLLLPQATHDGILLPADALVREGDLTGVYVRGAAGASELRWLQVGRVVSGRVEVLSGLRAGETVEIAAPIAREQ